MIKKIAWDAFKNTGDINTFLEYRQIESIQNNIKEIQNITNMNLETSAELTNIRFKNNQQVD